MASVADVDADVRDLGRGIISHLRFSLFSAGRTIDSSEKPFVGAEHANQRLFCAIAFTAQYADGRLASAERAGRWSSVEDLDFAMIRYVFGVGLKKNPGEDLIRISGGGVIVGLELFGVGVRF